MNIGDAAKDAGLMVTTIHSYGDMARIYDTAVSHAKHLHGTPVREVVEDGSLGPPVRRGGVLTRRPIETAFIADIPGAWPFDCHMPGRAAGAMTRWVRAG